MADEQRRGRRGGRRASVRTAAVVGRRRTPSSTRRSRRARPAARVLDIGGGTGGFAVPLAELGPPGHRRRPQPRRPGLPRPPRRARPASPTGSPACRATLTDLLDVRRRRPRRPGLLPRRARGRRRPRRRAAPPIAAVLRPGGALSLLVAQRHAAVLARAMAGHFAQARRALDERRRPVGRRATRCRAGSTRPAVAALLAAAGLHRRRTATASGSSPTWCPGRSSTPRPTAPPCSSSSGGRRPPAPSTSPLGDPARTPLRRHVPRRRPRPDARAGAAMSRRQYAVPERADPEPPDDTGCTVLHVDMDAFYASVDAARPARAASARPVIVGGGQPRRGALGHLRGPRGSACTSAMPMARARRLCPQAVGASRPTTRRYARSPRR